jgi:hypothetical protein
MDTITDILSTFFVSSKKPIKKGELAQKQQSEQAQSEHVPSEHVQSELVPSEHVQSESVPSEHVQSESVPSEHVQSESVSSESEQTEATFTESTLSSFISNNNSQDNKVQEDNNSQDNKVEQDNIVQEDKAQPRKYIMRAVGLCRKNITIVNTDANDNFQILSDLLHSFSIMNNVQDVFYNSICVVTSENKRKFKRMFLDNPYMYFTEFNVLSTLGSTKMKDITENEKRVIVILDMDSFRDNIYSDKYSELFQSRAQIILVSTSYTEDIINVYNQFGDNKIILHKKQKLKLLQKNFYNKLLRQVCDTPLSFEMYYKVMNEDNFGVKYIIVLGKELRYY